MRLARRFQEEIIAHAREGRQRDEEICGVLLGKVDDVSELRRIKNADPVPRIRYYMDDRELFQLSQHLFDADLDVVAIYHSHPHTRAYPSETDRRNAHDEEGRPLWPDVVYLICSMEQPDQPDLKAFRLFPDHAEDEALEIV